MTAIDDAAAKATDFLKSAENVVQAFRAMSPENRTRLQAWFPTLTTGCQMLGMRYDSLTQQTPPTVPK